MLNQIKTTDWRSSVWVVILIVLSLGVTGVMIVQRSAKHFVRASLESALKPISTDVSTLQQSLLSFESDLETLKQKPSVAAVSSTDDSASSAPAISTNEPAAPSTSGLINLNTASAAQLETLPGIGASYAARIIEGRPYSSIDQLQNVKGIGSKTIEKLRPLVAVP